MEKAALESKPAKNRSPLSSLTPFQGIVPVLHPSVFLACGARIVGDVTMAEGCSVWFNAVVRGDVHHIKIGKNTNIQDGAVIHCTYKKNPTHIGNNVSIGHLAIVHGCTVEDDCLIGMGAVVMDRALIGAGSLIGAGAVVTQGTQIPPRSLVMGSPAKVVRQVTDDEYKAFFATTQRYLEYADGYDYSIP